MKLLFILVVIGIVSCAPQKKNIAQKDPRLIGGIIEGIGGILGGGQGGGGGFQPGIGGGGFQPGIGGGFPGQFGGSSSGCRYWCKNQSGQFYCCEGANQNAGPVGLKTGQCPPVRLQCPPSRFFGGPKTCSNDGSCPGREKCCFDKCLEQHVCKQPIGFGGGIFGK